MDQKIGYHFEHAILLLFACQNFFIHGLRSRESLINKLGFPWDKKNPL